MQPVNRRTFIKLAGLTGISAALASCVPQTVAPALPTLPGGTSAPTDRPAPSATPVPPANLPEAGVIALNRLAFGPRPGDLDAFRLLGATDEARLSAWFEAQLNPASLDDSDFQARLVAAGFQTLDKSLEQLTYDHIYKNPYDPNSDQHWQWYIQPVEELVKATVLRAVYSRAQLQELLADFWHNHFNVYGWQDDVAPLLVSYDRDVIRANLFGNFRTFLEAVASHASMLFYLDNRTNSDAGPNENYARELFELHTLGAENYLGVRDPNTVPKNAQGVAVGYVDNDVYEAARAFTGWRVEDNFWNGEDGIAATGEFLYYRPWHDRFNKFVLGQYLPADQPDQKDGRDVLDLLAAHPGTADFIVRKLVRRFVADDPPERLVQAAAATFLQARQAPDQLAQVYRLILLSDEFRSTWGGKLKRPFEYAAGVLRGLESDFTRLPDSVRWTYEVMGQGLFGRTTPDGYPDAAAPWSNTMATLYGWNLTVGAAENWLNDDNPKVVMKTDVRAATPADLRSANALADFWIERLLGRKLPEASRAALVAFLAGDQPADAALSDDDLNGRLAGMVELILMSPEFRLR